MTICWGKRWVQYDVCTPIWVSHNRPRAVVRRPAVIAMRGPILGSRFVASPGGDDHAECEGKEGHAGFGC